jgi:hypothetical protein
MFLRLVMFCICSAVVIFHNQLHIEIIPQVAFSTGAVLSFVMFITTA